MFANNDLCFLEYSDMERRRAALDSFLKQCEDTPLGDFFPTYDDVLPGFNIAAFSDGKGNALTVAMIPWDDTAMCYPIAYFYLTVSDGWTVSGSIFNSELSGLEYRGDTPGESMDYPGMTLAETINAVLNADF
ncbi:MAG: hypothetical protein IKF78_16250 [Atopobiaceae bacterium]|nr:hypothetical protein [Atopobiaceae bacterium]